MTQGVMINPVTRIEGHAQIRIDVDGSGNVLSSHLQVWELRGFEKLLEGTELFKMPQVTARLCGVCPAAHHLASVEAIENGLGLEAPRDAKLLRELLYAGHILHSHALSNFVLTGPDVILGLGAAPETRNVFSLLKVDPDLIKKVLRLRSIGQRTVEIVGGRGIHPVTAIPGGMAKRPTAEELEVMSGWGQEAVGLVEELAAASQEWMKALAEIRPAVQMPERSVALSRGGTVSFIGGDCVVTGPAGKEERRFAAAAYASHFVERGMDSSYMKSVRLKGEGEASYYVGPLARFNANSSMSTPKAAVLFQAFKAEGPHLSPVDYIPARVIEMMHCAERMQAIAGGELGSGPLRVPASPREGRYIGLIEAPRGILIHDYTADAQGRVTDTNFIVATQNNYDAIDQTLTSMARHLIGKKDDNLLMNGLEFTLRCFDPCLACATHAVGRMPMEIVFRSEGRVLRSLTRRSTP